MVSHIASIACCRFHGTEDGWQWEQTFSSGFNSDQNLVVGRHIGVLSPRFPKVAHRVSEKPILVAADFSWSDRSAQAFSVSAEIRTWSPFITGAATLPPFSRSSSTARVNILVISGVSSNRLTSLSSSCRRGHARDHIARHMRGGSQAHRYGETMRSARLDGQAA
jgi:hypothetical protein